MNAAIGFNRMKYNPDLHHRRSIRLKGYDYSIAGAYFVTICTYQRHCLFGEVVDGVMQLNEAGQIAAKCWQWLAMQYSYVELDEWIVMPNHLHGILVLTDTFCKGGSRTAPTSRTVVSQNFGDRTNAKPLGRLIGAFKTISTKQINLIRSTPGTPVWQRNYYDHIICHEQSLQVIQQYIQSNPLSWQLDQLHPNNPSKW